MDDRRIRIIVPICIITGALSTFSARNTAPDNELMPKARFPPWWWLVSWIVGGSPKQHVVRSSIPRRADPWYLNLVSLLCVLLYQAWLDIVSLNRSHFKRTKQHLVIPSVSLIDGAQILIYLCIGRFHICTMIKPRQQQQNIISPVQRVDAGVLIPQIIILYELPDSQIPLVLDIIWFVWIESVVYFSLTRALSLSGFKLSPIPKQLISVLLKKTTHPRPTNPPKVHLSSRIGLEPILNGSC